MKFEPTTFTASPATESFVQFALKHPDNKRLLWLALIGMVVQFTIFKLLYPYPGFFGDSYWYIFAAENNLNINIWPIGYSKFLSAFHWLTHSDTALIATQYGGTIFSGLIFFYTVRYWFHPGKLATKLLYGFLFFNPLLLYLNNNVSSDGLFLALSLLWFSWLLWVVFKPSYWIVLIHAVALGLCFPLRYNALYYPLIAGLAFFLSPASLGKKVVGVTLPVVFIGAFIVYTQNASDQIAPGHKTFSAFSGWQWANNALYMYPYITVEEDDLPVETRMLNTVAKDYFDTTVKQISHKTPLDGAFYIWNQSAPLKRYRELTLHAHEQPYAQETDLKEWIIMAPTYAAYGKHLVLNHPLPYVRYYLLPNTYNYFVPQLEQLAIYNKGLTRVNRSVRQWFDYPDNRVSAWFPKLQKFIVIPFQVFFACLNFSFLYYMIYFFFNKQQHIKETSLKRGVYLVIALYLVNMGFSIVASPIMLRYQMFPLVVLTTFACVLIFPDVARVKEPANAKMAHPLKTPAP